MNVPRRIQLDKMVPAEKAIRAAVFEIEKLGADIRLTSAQIKLQEAKELVSHYVDEKLNTY